MRTSWSSTTTTRSPSTSSSSWASSGPRSRWCGTTARRSTDLLLRGYDRVLVSPGPCTPAEAGISVDGRPALPEAGIPTLGVCLGHQSLGAGVRRQGRAGEPVHGKTAAVDARRAGSSPGLPSPLRVGALPLAVVVDDAARLPRADVARRRGAHGHPPPRAARRGRAVPPGVRPDPGGQAAPGELPRSAVPNDVLTRAIDAVASREDLAREEAAARLREIMAGRGAPSPRSPAS